MGITVVLFLGVFLLMGVQLVMVASLPNRLIKSMRDVIRREAEARAEERGRADELAATRALGPALDALAKASSQAAAKSIIDELRAVIQEFVTLMTGVVQRAEERALAAERDLPPSTAPTSEEVKEDAEAQRHTVTLTKAEVGVILAKANAESVSDGPPSTVRTPNAPSASRKRISPHVPVVEPDAARDSADRYSEEELTRVADRPILPLCLTPVDASANDDGGRGGNPVG